MDQQKLLFDYSLKLLARRRYTERELAGKLKKKLGKIRSGAGTLGQTNNSSHRLAEQSACRGADASDASVTHAVGSSTQLIDQIISRLKDLKFLNDEEFVALYIRDQLARKPQGIRLLKNSLTKKGIAAETISNAIQAASIDETQLASTAIHKKSKSLASLPQKKREEKLMRFLLSRGFSINTVLGLFKDG